jgi:enoyl-CoA hydratase/carnithine racemase
MASVASDSELRTLTVADANGAARITLARPDKRNALSFELMSELIAVLEALGARSDVRAIVIEGSGVAFSAGHDLAEMVGRELPFYQSLFDRCTELMETIHRVPQPVIAKVHGIATAAGCQLVAACDLAVASEEARFATPGVKIGLFCSTPMVPLSRAIGRKRALEMLLTGEPISARAALEWGLVNRVVPASELDGAVEELIASITRSSPLTLAIGKEAFYEQVELDEHRAYDLTKSVMTMNSMADDAQEGIGAFLEKRPPKWTGT